MPLSPSLVSLKRLEQPVQAERSRDRRENAHGHRSCHPDVDADRRGTRHVGTLGASADYGAGVGAASARRVGVRARPDQHAKTPLIRRWLSTRPRFHLHFTPTGASWINLVERWFATLTQKQIRRGVHRSTRALEAAIIEYIAVTNEQPHPFRWTKTADEILASVERFCRRISDSRD
jgi:hypothetical protein